jgi:hypothetical protein
VGGRVGQLQFLSRLRSRSCLHHKSGKERASSYRECRDRQHVGFKLKPIQPGTNMPSVKPKAAEWESHRSRCDEVGAPPEHMANLHPTAAKRYRTNSLR